MLNMVISLPGIGVRNESPRRHCEVKAFCVVHGNSVPQAAYETQVVDSKAAIRSPVDTHLKSSKREIQVTSIHGPALETKM